LILVFSKGYILDPSLVGAWPSSILAKDTSKEKKWGVEQKLPHENKNQLHFPHSGKWPNGNIEIWQIAYCNEISK